MIGIKIYTFIFISILFVQIFRKGIFQETGIVCSRECIQYAWTDVNFECWCCSIFEHFDGKCLQWVWFYLNLKSTGSPKPSCQIFKLNSNNDLRAFFLSRINSEQKKLMKYFHEYFCTCHFCLINYCMNFFCTAQDDLMEKKYEICRELLIYCISLLIFYILSVFRSGIFPHKILLGIVVRSYLHCECLS
jgi:hypothetical protein